MAERSEQHFSICRSNGIDAKINSRFAVLLLPPAHTRGPANGEKTDVADKNYYI